ncbi:hypothetical protein [Hungatella hathewayi]|uniref:hypothetical protein n=1 Tax=Hungatella hathewayi TaxID=154046 RepID=UPI0035654C06
MSEFKKEKNTFGETTSHPSYGMLAFSRRTGGKNHLFGSSIEHNDVIAMTLRHGEITRELNTDWYYGDKIIAEVEMSYSQFAEAITSMNMGSGVPVTIRRTEKDGRIPDCDFINKRVQFEDEFADKMDRVNQEMEVLLKEVSKLFSEKKNISQTDRKYILSVLTSIQSEVTSNTKFAYECFNEQMDKTVMEAKGEIEAFCQNKLSSIAQATLVEHREDIKHLENPVNIDM